jgi:hypothetical protein
MIQTHTHGGARPGSGRKPKPGWKLVGVRLQERTIRALQALAQAARKSQSELTDKALQEYLHLD